MGRPISYDAYVRQYYAEASKHEMWAPMFDEETFESVYEGMVNTLKERGMRVQNITRSIIQKQAYEISFKQAKSLQTARKNLGMEKITLREIRSLGKADALDWAEVKARYQEYKDAVEELQAAREELEIAEASGDPMEIMAAEEQYEDVLASIDPAILDIIEQTEDAAEGEFASIAEDEMILDILDASDYIAQVIFGSE